MQQLALVSRDDDERGAARVVFSRFEDAGIAYCHFKSNAFLGESLAGHADLDVLVDRRQASVVAEVLSAAGFRLFRSSFLTRYPSVEDYLGYDLTNGRLVHLHLHHRLLVGARGLKGHDLPCAGDVLATAIPDPATGILRSTPAYELFLLLVRTALKVTWRDTLQGVVGRPYIRGRTRQEFDWLCGQTEAGEVQAIVARELGSNAATLVPSLLERPPSVFQLRNFRWRARRALAECRRKSPGEGAVIRFAAKLTGAMSRLNSRFMRQPRPFRRTPHAGGVMIAFVGTHGAGKSTVTKEIERWLSVKVDAYRVYFGSGAGTPSMLRWPMKVVADLRSRIHPKRSRAKADLPGEARWALSGEARWMTLARVVWALALALEKRSKLKRSLRAKRRGMIVICDRYPQIQVFGYNDGPLLGVWLNSTSSLRRALARFERQVYETAARLPPDLIIKLDLPPNVAAIRRPEETLDELTRRREAVRRMHFDRCQHVEIDASVPVDEVLRSAKWAVWNTL